MKRRHFLGGAAALATASLWPSWLRDAFADPAKACDPKSAASVAAQSTINVAAAFRKATRAKKPLLVLVIPADDTEKWNRGHAFGESLNHGADTDIAPLADCEVVCATMDSLEIVPSAGRGEPLMVLVRTTSVPVTSEQIDAEMPSYDEVIGRGKRGANNRPASDKIIDERIAVLGGLLRKTFGSGTGRLRARVDEVRARLRDKPPAGTHWARSEGCGSIIEGVRETSHIGCGMGYSPARSRRFLYFFSSDSLY